MKKNIRGCETTSTLCPISYKSRLETKKRRRRGLVKKENVATGSGILPRKDTKNGIKMGTVSARAADLKYSTHHRNEKKGGGEGT